MAHSKIDNNSSPIREQADRLQNLATTRWRERLMRDAIFELSQCRTEKDAFTLAGKAVSLLWGPNVVCHAYDSRVAGTINHVWAGAPMFSFPKHSPDPSHVGYVIKSGTTVYEPDVRNPLHTHLKFDFVDELDPTRTAFTVFLHLSEGRRGAFQVLAQEPGEFPSTERETLESILLVLAVTIQRLSRPGLETLADPLGSEWRNSVFRALLDDPEGIALHTRKQLYQAVAGEAMRVAKAYNAAVRLFDRSENCLWFVACVGEGWTRETKFKAFRLENRNSAGLDAVECRQPVYIADYEGHPRYQAFFPGIKSLCAIPFIVQGGRVAGVVSVAWTNKCGLGDREDLEPLEQLVRDFEKVLAQFGDKEELAFRKLEEQIAEGAEARVFEQQIVERLYNMFGVEGCSLFLQFPDDEDILRMVASTHMPPNGTEVTYVLSDELVGACAREQRTLCYTDAGEWVVREGEWRNAVGGSLPLLLVPMIAESRSLGVIRLEGRLSGDAFTLEDESILSEIGRRLGKVWKRFWRNERDRQRADKLRSLLNVHEADLTVLISSIASWAERFTGATAAKLVVWDRADGAKVPLTAGSLQLRCKDHEIPWKSLYQRQPDHRLILEIGESRIGDDVLELLDESVSYESFFWHPFHAGKPDDVLRPEGILMLAWREGRGSSYSEDEVRQLLDWILSILPAAFHVERIVQEFDNLRLVSLRIGLSGLSDLMTDILGACLRWSGTDYGEIRVWEPSRHAWIVYAGSDVHSTLDPPRSFPTIPSSMRRALIASLSVYCQSSTQMKTGEAMLLLWLTSLRAVICMGSSPLFRYRSGRGSNV
jgi:GAF domain-containing protein